MKAKETLLLNNTITPNPILARRGWFWHLALQLSRVTLFIRCACGFLVKVQTKFQLPTVVQFCGIHTPTTDIKSVLEVIQSFRHDSSYESCLRLEMNKCAYFKAPEVFTT